MKKVRYIFLIFLLFLFGCSQEPSFDILYGTVYQTGTNTVSVITDDFVVHTFSDADISAPDSGVQIGYPVTVTLDPENLCVQSIAVLDYSGCTALQQAHHRMMVMTLEQKVGQMFMVRCPETDAAEKAGQYQVGGYILFARDFRDKNRDDVIHDIQSYQSAVSTPMLIGVDEEGGTVNRISRYPAFRDVPFRSPQELYSDGGLDRIVCDTKEKCALLSELGIRLNFAPVCDVSQDPADYIYSRTFGLDAEQTAQYIRCVVEAMRGSGVGCVLKHFPGYGNNLDTHTGVAVDTRDYSVFERSDFLPFQAGINAGADMVLVAHNIVECMDPAVPASLSPKVHQILREELGFTGVVITDDLYMDAIKQYTGTTAAAVSAVLAGNDMLCCTDFEVQIPAVLAAVKDGTIPEDMVNACVERILALKITLGIL